MVLLGEPGLTLPKGVSERNMKKLNSLIIDEKKSITSFVECIECIFFISTDSTTKGVLS